MKLYTSPSKRLILENRKFWGLMTMFVEVTEEKLVGGKRLFIAPYPPTPLLILNNIDTLPTIFHS